MEIVKEITQCSSCPFCIHTMDGMECRHPYWDDKKAYQNMIIPQSNIGGIPNECPLKNGSVSIIVKLPVLHKNPMAY